MAIERFFTEGHVPDEERVTRVSLTNKDTEPGV